MSTTVKTRAPRAARDAWEWAMRNLPDVPAKVETNARGQLVLSPPPSPSHQFTGREIMHVWKGLAGRAWRFPGFLWRPPPGSWPRTWHGCPPGAGQR